MNIRKSLGLVLALAFLVGAYALSAPSADASSAAGGLSSPPLDEKTGRSQTISESTVTQYP